MLSRRLSCLFFFAFILTTAAPAGLVIESSLQESGKAAVPSKMIMDSAGLRADSAEGTFIFRPDKQVFWVLDDANKEYSQITEADLARMGSKMEEAMGKMKEQLAQLPAEQRAMVEDMMKKQLGSDMAPTPEIKISYEKVAGGEKVGSWTCDKYVEKQNGLKIGEIWTVPPTTFGSFTSYFQVLKKLGAFFGKLPAAQNKMNEFPLVKATEGPTDSGLSGIPVKDIRYQEDGTISNQWQLTKISEEPSAPELFELPKDYKQRALMEESH